ncbi:HU family DNA-binding protein [Rhizosphaericola mali]|uniref:HU family DNA-binding protein n=1 Tax=Rhizosphaericola mali TaxID=2545455 RepID=A0A5P2G9K4_9BACT|nr:HU family DNA-binding protein [Rhizosphaericola mali]QES88211.1 HU family DNA-binding protein [Rhizosphaericola mali]
MNKTELIEALASKAGTSKVAAATLLDAFTATVSDTLKKEEPVVILGFGTFSVSARSARTGRNPQTGEPLKIKATKVAKFKAGTKLAESVKKAKKKAAPKK